MKSYKILPYEKMDGVMWNLNWEAPSQCLISFANQLDITSGERLRASLAAAGGQKPSYTALLAKAVATAMKEFPYANTRVFRRLFGSRAIRFDDINISVAVERESVMHANPETLYKADSMTLVEMDARIRGMHAEGEQPNQRWAFFQKLVRALPEFISKFLASLPRFSPKMWLEHRGGAVLITSPAKYGVDMITTGNWQWPITFTFGLVKPRPTVVDGEVVARRTMPLGMVFDRRIMAGAPAAKFFNRICEILEHAEKELGEKKQPTPAVNRISERLCPKRLGIEAAFLDERAGTKIFFDKKR